MIFIVIVFATLAAGIGSVWVAALLMRAGLGSSSDGVGPRHLLSLAAGALLAMRPETRVALEEMGLPWEES